MNVKFVDETVVFEDVRLLFRNLGGREGQYNREGDRNFAILIDDPGVAEELITQGWAVKRLKPRPGEEDVPNSVLSVNVSFSTKARPPRIFMITSKGRTLLDEDTVAALDWADIAGVDVIVRPYRWVVGTDAGVKAYLKTMFVTINEDLLELKYADVEDVGSRYPREE